MISDNFIRQLVIALGRSSTAFAPASRARGTRPIGAAPGSLNGDGAGTGDRGWRDDALTSTVRSLDRRLADLIGAEAAAQVVAGRRAESLADAMAGLRDQLTAVSEQLFDDLEVAKQEIVNIRRTVLSSLRRDDLEDHPEDDEGELERGMDDRTTPTGVALLTPGEVAAMLSVDPETVARWAKAGRLTSIRTGGGHRRYREGDVRAILEGIPEQRAE